MPTPPASAADPIEVEYHEHDPSQEPEHDDEAPHEPLLDKLEELGQHVTDFVVQRPLAAVGLALAVGFLFGRMMRR